MGKTNTMRARTLINIIYLIFLICSISCDLKRECKYEIEFEGEEVEHQIIDKFEEVFEGVDEEIREKEGKVIDIRGMGDKRLIEELTKFQREGILEDKLKDMDLETIVTASKSVDRKISELDEEEDEEDEESEAADNEISKLSNKVMGKKSDKAEPGDISEIFKNFAEKVCLLTVVTKETTVFV